MISPQYDKSIEFLRRWAPAGPWLLTSIEPDQKQIETRTFRPETEADCLRWLERNGASRNIYFSVNPPTRDLAKKADREDIAAMCWLHVDIDPRAGEDIAAEQARALKSLQSPPGNLPKPTVIVFSGGGYQGFWKLDQPVPINGDMSAAEDAKRYNLQIELLFTADNCHNVDRIMRLPGTINRPDAKKRKKGRTEALATLIEWNDTSYAIEKFTKAQKTQAGNDSGFANRTIKVSGNLKRLNGVDELPDAVSNKAKVVIAQGHDPNEPTKFNSRSEWLFFACCEMCRANCSDDLIFSVITDPAFGISASVLDKGSGAERYALRQIERAREEAVDKDLRVMNEKFAIIGNWNGKCRVIEEVWDATLKRFRVTKQSFDDFRNRWLHVGKALVGPNNQPVTKPMGHWWLAHPNRRQYDTLVFAPGQETPNAYNLWRGFACDARPGDCGLFLDHLKNNVCRGVPEYYDYLIKWMASSVQKPDSPGYSAIVMRGGQGTGKGFTAKTLGSLFGRHYMQVTDPKHLVGSFNAHLRDCVLLFGDEAFYAGDKKHESILKMLITEELLTIEAKGVDAEAGANCVHLMMASNEHWVVPAGLDDRRFFVLDIGDDQKNQHDYFQKMQAQLNLGGREALLHHLMTMDLKGFNVRNVPKTAALQQQKVYSFSPEEEWWYQKLKEGRLLTEHSRWMTEICTLDLQADFINYSRNFSTTRRSNATRLGFAIQRFVPEMKTEQRRTPVEVTMPDGTKKNIMRPYFYMFPSLEACRAVWDKHFGGPFDWPKSAEEQGELDGMKDASPF